MTRYRRLVYSLLSCASRSGVTSLHIKAMTQPCSSSTLLKHECKVVHELKEIHVQQLWKLYQNEWWTKQRTLEETRNAVAGSQIIVGIIKPVVSNSATVYMFLTPSAVDQGDKDESATAEETDMNVGDTTIAPLPKTQLIGFARILTDYAIKALIFDVIIDPEYRGYGLGKQLMETILQHDQLQAVQQFELYCLPEMEAFYESKFGFSSNVGGISLMRKTTDA